MLGVPAELVTFQDKRKFPSFKAIASHCVSSLAFALKNKAPQNYAEPALLWFTSGKTLYYNNWQQNIVANISPVIWSGCLYRLSISGDYW